MRGFRKVHNLVALIVASVFFFNIVFSGLAFAESFRILRPWIVNEQLWNKDSNDERFYQAADSLSETSIDNLLESLASTFSKNFQVFFRKRISPDLVEFFDKHKVSKTRILAILKALDVIGESLSKKNKNEEKAKMIFFEWISFRLLEYDSLPKVLMSGSQENIEAWLEEEFRTTFPVYSFGNQDFFYGVAGEGETDDCYSGFSQVTLKRFCELNGVNTKSEEAVDAFLGDFFNGQRKGLELGPGWDPYICKDIKEKYKADLTACDINFRALRIAKQNYDVPIKRGNILELPFEANTFDYIIGISVLPYVLKQVESESVNFIGNTEYLYTNAEKVAGELYRIAKQGCTQLYFFKTQEDMSLVRYFEDAGRNIDGGGFEILSEPISEWGGG